MIQSCILRGLLVLLCVFCQTPETLTALYVLIFLRFSVNSVYVPARTAMVPGVVEKTDLLVANGLDGVVWSSMIFFGGAVGGLGTALVGVTGSFLLDALAYLIAAYVIALLREDIDIQDPDKAEVVVVVVDVGTGTVPSLIDPFWELLSSLRKAVRWFYVNIMCCVPLRRKSSTPVRARVKKIPGLGLKFWGSSQTLLVGEDDVHLHNEDNHKEEGDGVIEIELEAGESPPSPKQDERSPKPAR
jgi:MFS family permease